MREGNEETVLYFSAEEEVRKFDESNLDLNLFENELDTAQAPARKDGPRRRGRLVEVHEHGAIQKLISELARKGLKIEHYSDSDKPIFELIEGDGEGARVHPIFSIPRILEMIKEIGRRGVQIKRFKGLGEINPKELRDYDESRTPQIPAGGPE